MSSIAFPATSVKVRLYSLNSPSTAVMVEGDEPIQGPIAVCALAEPISRSIPVKKHKSLFIVINI